MFSTGEETKGEELTMKEGHVSLNALGKFVGGSHMKLTGECENMKLQVLVDSGSTHSFFKIKL